jgi:hypothetical protein
LSEGLKGQLAQAGQQSAVAHLHEVATAGGPRGIKR